ncbi:MAG TPA: hypothetical protein VNN25_22995 [Thermoanaerobaculia bacterium]|nr:hypothetical protein [Thermoanaerobaculia bacterium]
MSTVNEVSQSHTDSAQARVDEIRAMRQLIPNFVIPASTSANRSLITAASLPQQFIELAAMAVKNSTALVRGGGVDPAQIRDLMSFAEAYGPVADELDALAQFIRHSVTAARNTAGSDALTTYALARRLAKRPETAELAPHVNDMRNALGTRFRKAKAHPAPTPAPVPATPLT